jgi:hypothetical protein
MYRPTALGPLTSVPAPSSSTSWCCRMGRRSTKPGREYPPVVIPLSTQQLPDATHGWRAGSGCGSCTILWFLHIAGAFSKAYKVAIRGSGEVAADEARKRGKI